jgi:hypothetical protein
MDGSGERAASSTWLKKRSDARALVRFHRDKFAFLIRLSETDASTLIASERPGDLPNFVHGFYRFNFLAAQGDLRNTVLRLADAIRADPRPLKATIEKVRALLSALADGERFEWEFRRGSAVVLDGAAFKADKDRGGVVLLSPSGALDQAVVAHVMCTFGEIREVAAMVRRCKRERCLSKVSGRNRLFVATRPRQIFCSRQCGSADAFERYKRSEKYAEAHRKASRKFNQKLKERG